MRKLNLILQDEKKLESLKLRFAAKVRTGSESDCWNWISKSKHDFGYGRMSAGRGVHLKSHQVAFALKNGPIPEGLCVLHRCDNPGCCNPSHLFLGTKKDNTRDMMNKGRMSRPPVSFGEDHHNTKFGTDDASKIRADPRPASKIAQEYGVCARTIYRHKRNQTWKNFIVP